MSDILDYLDLRLRVGDQVGNRNLSDLMVGFTRQAERVLNHRLRTGWQIEAFIPAWVGNEADLPADFLQLVETDNGIRVQGAKVYRRPYHTRPGGLDYYQKLPTITTGPDGTNWLLQQYPMAYLHAVSVEAAKHIKSVEIGVASQGLLDGELAMIKIEDDRARYANRTVRVAGCTP